LGWTHSVGAGRLWDMDNGESARKPLAGDRKCRLMEIVSCKENAIPDGCDPLTRAVVVARRDGDVLLVLDKTKHSWELPGGCIQGDESPRDCIVREFTEETGQDPWYLEFVGVYRLEFRQGNRVEYGALFESKFADLRLFVPSRDVAKLEVWNPAKKLEGMEPIDRELALFVLKS